MAQRRGWGRAISAVLPERQIVTMTEQGPHTVRIGSGLQLLAGLTTALALGWMAYSTAVLVADRIGARDLAGPAAELHDAYLARLNALAEDRDRRAAEAASAQARFHLAMDKISDQQTALIDALEERRELEATLGQLRNRLADLTEAQMRQAEASQDAAGSAGSGSATDLAAALEAVTAALGAAVTERETLAEGLASAETRLAEAERDHLATIADLRAAVAASMSPLEATLRRADLDVDSLIAVVRQDFAGTGGPMVPLGVSTRARDGDIAATSPIDDLMLDIDRLNFLRIAIGRVPYAIPVKDAHRFTSGFGPRRDPKGRGTRMHAGVDFAAPKGTPIYATADGVVTSARSESGYGLTVRIQHDFGFETVYAHQSRLRVEPGQRVSRGEHIGDMGSTGRSTGVHLHYEVRLNGRPVNPMIYVEAAKDVF